MSEGVRKENKMGVMNENKLLITMSLPIIISMLVQAMYNVVDSLFVARINEDALTAVSLAFPAQNLLISIAVGTAVGVNSLLSRHLGEKNYDAVEKTAHNGIFLAFASFLAFLVFGLLFSRTYFTVQTDIDSIVNYGSQYLSIILICSFGMLQQLMFERILQATGKTIYTMVTQGLGAIINIVLDPIMIFGLFGFPRLEVAGAAVATVTGQVVAMVLAILFNLKFNEEVDFHIKKCRPDGPVIRQIYQVGLPAIIMQSVASVMTFGLNKILLMFTSTATAVFGIYFKLQSFVFMPVFGINNGLIPIVGYNYGARHPERIIKVMKYAVCYAVAIMLAGFAVIELFPESILRMFNASEHMMSIGVITLRVIALSYLFAGFCVVVGALFQALGNGMMSLIVSVARQLVILLPVAYIFAKVFGLNAVWWAFPIAEIGSLTISLIFLKKVYAKEIKPLYD